MVLELELSNICGITLGVDGHEMKLKMVQYLEIILEDSKRKFMRVNQELLDVLIVHRLYVGLNIYNSTTVRQRADKGSVHFWKKTHVKSTW